jgi:hypothetical protein
MSKTKINLVGSNEEGRLLISEAEAFLLGPRGEVWDLDPQLGCRPRLLAHCRDGVPVLAANDESPAKLHFSISHRNRYLELRAVDARLLPMHVADQFKGGRYDLRSDNGALTLDDSERLRQPIILQQGRWEGATLPAPYLLLCSRSIDLRNRNLLACAREHALPQIEAAPWKLPLTVGLRGRLSPLADVTRRPLRRALAASSP